MIPKYVTVLERKQNWKRGKDVPKGYRRQLEWALWASSPFWPLIVLCSIVYTLYFFSIYNWFSRLWLYIFNSNPDHSPELHTHTGNSPGSLISWMSNQKYKCGYVQIWRILSAINQICPAYTFQAHGKNASLVQFWI